MYETMLSNSCMMMYGIGFVFGVFLGIGMLLIYIRDRRKKEMEEQ